jgi:DUF2075 family protein
MQKLLQAQMRLIEIAQENQKEFQGEHFKENDSLQNKNITVVYPDESYIVAQYKETAMGNKPKNKLNTTWRGPMLVLNHVGSKYNLQNLLVNGMIET